MVSGLLFQEKIDNIQHQLDTMQRENAAFRSYASTQFDRIFNEMGGMARKQDLRDLEARLETRMATKEELAKLTELVEKINRALMKTNEIVIKIADKVGVTP